MHRFFFLHTLTFISGTTYSTLSNKNYISQKRKTYNLQYFSEATNNTCLKWYDSDSLPEEAHRSSKLYSTNFYEEINCLPMDLSKKKSSSKFLKKTNNFHYKDSALANMYEKFNELIKNWNSYKMPNYKYYAFFKTMTSEDAETYKKNKKKLLRLKIFYEKLGKDCIPKLKTIINENTEDLSLRDFLWQRLDFINQFFKYIYDLIPPNVPYKNSNQHVINEYCKCAEQIPILFHTFKISGFFLTIRQKFYKNFSSAKNNALDVKKTVNSFLIKLHHSENTLDLSIKNIENLIVLMKKYV